MNAQHQPCVWDSGTCSWVLLLSRNSLQKFLTFQASYILVIRSLAKECPWAVKLTSLSKNGLGAFSSVYFNHEGVPVSCLQSSKHITGQKKNVQRSNKGMFPYPTIQWCHEYSDRGISETTWITHHSTSQSVIIAILGYNVVLAQVKFFYTGK